MHTFTHILTFMHTITLVQAALPFKTKPKLEAARKPGKRGTLEQRRAVVLEPHERKAATLLQQLNAIRNDKATKRREQQVLGCLCARVWYVCASVCVLVCVCVVCVYMLVHAFALAWPPETVSGR